ncbi:MAG: 4'-phosphopantetheinyl transferase superfamily protein [Woeseiaceae bacterium]|nr:4'-phosphopantetheinyl transferase superfamily protein [Woeseiaceae bacterium]
MTRATLRVAWATNTDLAAVTDDAIQPQEREQAGRYQSGLRRRQYVASRAMLRALLADHTGQPAASFELIADERGKPICVDGPAISISHSGDIVACAVMDADQVGIDVEFPGRPRNTSGIAERYFSRDEAEWLAARDSDHFYRLWVLKEAWLKATGIGIAGGLDQLRCIVEPPHVRLLDDSAPVAALRLYALDDGFLGLATVDTSPAATEVRRWLPAQGVFAVDDRPVLLASSDAT